MKKKALLLTLILMFISAIAYAACDDMDGDTICAEFDNCPAQWNPNQADSDSDGIGNWCDSCPDDANNDEDLDGICAAADNCPDAANPGQEDVDSDGLGDVCDTNTIYGTISGDVQEGITVNIYICSCGAPQPHSTVTTDSRGYYSIGDNLANGRYLVSSDYTGFSFSNYKWVDISLTESQSYDFTATAD
jgi:hypothetical protein